MTERGYPMTPDETSPQIWLGIEILVDALAEALVSEWTTATRARDLTVPRQSSMRVLAALEQLVFIGVAEGGTDEFGARVFRRRQ